VSAAPLRVAAAQAVSVSGDVVANVRTATELVHEAADADLVVLPELFLTGYDPDAWTPDNTVTGADPRLAPLCAAALATKTVVVVGAAVERNLSALVIDRAGVVCTRYDKQHLSGEEKDAFVAGSHGTSIVVDGWEVGLGICYDGCFPEHAMAAAGDGARLYVCPGAYFAGSEHRRDLYYAARALDNGIYVAFAGLPGSCGDRQFGGGSAIYDPEGRTLARAGNERAVVAADIDPCEVTRVQNDVNPVALDRLQSMGERHRVSA
jgi:predicted amidohydrolase